MAVVLCHLADRRGRRRALAGVPAALRLGTHLPLPEADPGLDPPESPPPDTADLWTWLVIAAHTQLRLARPLAADLRRPWERPLPQRKLTPARVRRGFRHIRPKTALPSVVPKPPHPGPGRPLGSKNHQPATRHDVGKTVKRELTLEAHQQKQAAAG